MKLVLAIINNDDAGAVSSALTRAGFSATKLATTGGFLKVGNTTLLIGVEDAQVQKVTDVIAQHSSKRSQLLPDTSSYSGEFASMPIEVTVGGATLFVLDVAQFLKL